MSKKNHQINITYDGAYPNYCSGTFVIDIDGRIFVSKQYSAKEYYEFMDKEVYGFTGFDDDWSEQFENYSIGGQRMTSELERFKRWLDSHGIGNLFTEIMQMISDEYGEGCCGGCI